jgi:hypothetical protein
MKGIRFLITTALLAVMGYAQNAGGPSLDIVGIKLGMSVKDAMLALKADNAQLTLTPFTFRPEGFTNDLLLMVEGKQLITSSANDQVERAGETVEILFTLPPNAEVVWGVKRQYTFATKERPALENILEALHRKYGLETLPPRLDPRELGKHVAWVYDAQGKPMGPAGAALYTACGTLIDNHFSGDSLTRNEILAGQAVPPQCNSIIIVRAIVQATRFDQSNPQLAVYFMTVSITDGPRHRAATDATRAVVLNAARSRQNKETEDVKKRGVPKL